MSHTNQQDQYAAQKRYRERHKEKIQEIGKRYYQKNKELLRKKYLAIKLITLQHYCKSEVPFCQCCGYMGLAFLTIDHINNDGYKFRKQRSSNFYWYLHARAYPNDPPLQVLCWNCNEGKRINKGLCPHEDVNSL